MMQMGRVYRRGASEWSHRHEEVRSEFISALYFTLPIDKQCRVGRTDDWKDIIAMAVRTMADNQALGGSSERKRMFARSTRTAEFKQKVVLLSGSQPRRELLRQTFGCGSGASERDFALAPELVCELRTRARTNRHQSEASRPSIALDPGVPFRNATDRSDR